MKTRIFTILIFLSIFLLPIKVDALIPVTYYCCSNYSYNNGNLLNGFENTLGSGIQLDGFENLSNWTKGGTGVQQVDTVNFMEGIQGLKLVANGNSAYTDKVINNNFSTTNNFGFWLYVYNSTSIDGVTIYFTSTGNTWIKFFRVSRWNLVNGWNRIFFLKSDFNNTGGENWNNTMNKIRIAVVPFSGQNTSVTVDDLRHNLTNDWILETGSLQSDTVNFKEGQRGLKLVATDGSAYMDLPINSNFSTTNNFAIWTYVDNASQLQGMTIYFTSNGFKNSWFHDSVWATGTGNVIKTGWNKLVFNKHSFSNIGGENWNSIMNRIRLRIYPLGTKLNVTFDDLRYDMSGQRAKLIITFDDGRLSTYTKAYSILSTNNQRGVSLVVTSWVDLGYIEFMNLSNLRALQSAGWDISSHTTNHHSLPTLNDSTLTYELNNSYDWFIANKFQKSAGFIAYPYGAFNDIVIDKTKKRYILGRATVEESAQQHFNPTDNDTIQYIQREIGVFNTTTVQSVEDKINDSINSKLLGILVFHDIVDSNPSLYQYLKADFQAISDYIKSRSTDIDVITYSDYVIPNINSFTPVINKTARIYSNGSSILITNNKYDEYMPNMTIKSSSGSIDINITAYNETEGLIKFNESSQNNNLQVSYGIGDRIPNQMYRVKIYWINGTKYQDFNILANSTGYINYNSTGFGDSRYQEINIGDSIDTSFTVTLPVGYTFLRFNAPNSTLINLDPDGQSGSQSIFSIVNNGNIIQSFGFYLNGTIANITTYADLDNNHATGRIEINTTSSMVITNLNPGSSQNVWFTIDAIKAPTINSNRMLTINSS